MGVSAVCGAERREAVLEIRFLPLPGGETQRQLVCCLHLRVTACVSFSLPSVIRPSSPLTTSNDASRASNHSIAFEALRLGGCSNSRHLRCPCPGAPASVLCLFLVLLSDVMTRMEPAHEPRGHGRLPGDSGWVSPIKSQKPGDPPSAVGEPGGTKCHVPDSPYFAMYNMYRSGPNF